MTLQTRQIGPGFAVEISGIQLGELDDAHVEALREVWIENKVAVLPEQHLSDDQLLAFTRRMGPLFVHVRSMFHSSDYPEIMFVSNLKEDGRALGSLGDGDLGWHTDQCYTARPCWATLLYGLEIPADGGDTYFANLEAAYERMPDDLRAAVDGQRVVYSVLADTISKKSPISAEQRARTPDVIQPLVRTHPYTGRKALYASPNHYVRIVDMEQSAGDELFRRLKQWIGQPEFVYAHRWRVGDVVLWDNASVAHRRDAFPSEQRRFLKRTGFHLPEELAAPF
ncbi:MAG: taurine dioxygenase [Gammaproteobacteria bacterium]|jgi:taurine dioxygenase